MSELLHALRALGYTVRAEDDQVCLTFTGQEDPPVAAVRPLVEQLRQGKAAVLAALLAEAEKQNTSTFPKRLQHCNNLPDSGGITPSPSVAGGVAGCCNPEPTATPAAPSPLQLLPPLQHRATGYATPVSLVITPETGVPLQRCSAEAGGTRLHTFAARVGQRPLGQAPETFPLMLPCRGCWAQGGSKVIPPQWDWCAHCEPT